MKLGQKVAIGVLSVTFLSCLFILLTDTDATAAGNRLEELQRENADLKLRLTHALRQGQLTTALSKAHVENSHTSPPASAALPEEGRCPSPNSVVVGFVCGYGPLAEAVGDEPVPKESWYRIHQQFELALKSILINTKRNVTVVVFTNRLGRDTIRSTLVAQLLPATRARLRLVPVLVQPAAIRRYVASVGLQWAPLEWGMTKVLAHELLPDCFEWLLLLDADVMFAGDVRELWHLRHAFNATQLLGGYQEYTYNAASLARLRKTYHVPDMHGFNSGVLLMNLQRMKDQDLARSLLLRANHLLYPAWTDPYKVAASKFRHGEQDLFNSVLAAFPAMRFELPPRWNTQGCGKYSKEQQAELSEWPGLFHFNCHTRQIDAWELVLAQQSRLRKTPLSSPALCNCPTDGVR